MENKITSYWSERYHEKVNNFNTYDWSVHIFYFFLVQLCTREEAENMNRPVMNTEIEAVIKNLPTNKCQGPDAFTDISIKHLEKH